jgi:hypothetical protein
VKVLIQKGMPSLKRNPSIKRESPRNQPKKLQEKERNLRIQLSCNLSQAYQHLLMKALNREVICEV